MLQFFRTYDPFRLLTVLFLLLALRLPLLLDVFFLDIPLLSPILDFMLVGERVADGNAIYKEVFAGIAPFSAWFYAGLDMLFGRSAFGYALVGTGLLFIQAIIFNTLLLRRDFLLDRGYVPAMLYVFFGSISFDYFNVSPVLLSLTFLLLVLREIFTLTENTHDQTLFTIGFYLGIATLFHLPSSIFLFWVSVGLGVFRSTSFRQHLLVLFGFGFPILLLSLYFFWNDSFIDFVVQFISSVSTSPRFYLSIQDFILILASPLLFLVLAILNMFSGRSLTNYQSYCRQMMIFWLLASTFSLLFCKYWLPFQFALFLPPVAFFGTYYLFSIQRKWISELLFLSILSGIGLQLWATRTEIFYPIDYTKAIIKKPSNFNLKNEKIWVFGENHSYYIDNKPVTPYLDWKLTQNRIEELDNYQALLLFYNQIEKEKPQFIIDKEKQLPPLFERIPLLSKKYTTKDSLIYELKK
ncbi:hypothetical protein Fleli_2463 [Bernardetia litoralis DSM 6794]|uniref:Glycosyltransferase RgtA/B/C/D-like domain-containing protein n=1 Tax=Bernardetia litoralis (strain ATCC 23117 / DSM 6794 / NBRC 15988 / NCIMB 1366 / Fx l1 / Sio-4) TaxID=880071 RepID=I4ALJ4_BERLS|nr:hypothetical protein [Bernardetia litoralis]AFM04829.1 hypothetical protein Fleli_2463 [Bernardetia litoralis DSM 6794]